jgi:hypothetical protein
MIAFVFIVSAALSPQRRPACRSTAGAVRVSSGGPLARRAAAAPLFSVLQTPLNSLNQHATESPSRCRSPALLLRVWSRGGALPRVAHPSWRWRKYTGHSRHLGPRARPLQRDSPRLPAPLASYPLAAWCSAGGGKAKSVFLFPSSTNPPPRY